MSDQSEASFAEHVVELAALAKALGHPARVRILEVLAQSPGCICGDIVVQMPLAQATVSQHLKELKSAGLIEGEIDGPRTCYCLNLNKLARAREMFTSLFAGIGCCGGEGEPHGIESE